MTSSEHEPPAAHGAMRGDSDFDGGSTPQPPYGPPIHDAIASGDLQQMKAVAEAARKALYGVEFESVAADRRGEVKQALDALDMAITRMDPSGGSTR